LTKITPRKKRNGLRADSRQAKELLQKEANFPRHPPKPRRGKAKKEKRRKPIHSEESISLGKKKTGQHEKRHLGKALSGETIEKIRPKKETRGEIQVLCARRSSWGNLNHQLTNRTSEKRAGLGAVAEKIV